MPKRMAVIDCGKCHPEKCDKGICVPLSSCPRPDELFIQETPGDYPYIMQDSCRGCGDCCQARRVQAIRILQFLSAG